MFIPITMRNNLKEFTQFYVNPDDIGLIYINPEDDYYVGCMDSRGNIIVSSFKTLKEFAEYANKEIIKATIRATETAKAELELEKTAHIQSRVLELEPA